MNTVITYKCEFCGALNEDKDNCQKHETHCHKNPNNKHKCYDDCKFLYRVDHLPWNLRLFCAYNLERMYSYKAEKEGFEIPSDYKRMPLACEMYEKHNRGCCEEAMSEDDLPF